ncbi:MAG TPA: hypothetical protein VGC43_01200, partial [Luteimonas sp.]
MASAAASAGARPLDLSQAPGIRFPQDFRRREAALGHFDPVLLYGPDSRPGPTMKPFLACAFACFLLLGCKEKIDP